MEILYNLRLGSELGCKYGPDLEINIFQVKEEKSISKYKEEEMKKGKNRNSTGFSGVKSCNIVN